MRLITATVVLLMRDSRVLVLRRTPEDRSFAGAWCLPGGRVDAGEGVEDAVRRETLEETGLDADLWDVLGPRRVSLPGRDLVFDIHRFVGGAKSGEVILSEEHTDHSWLDRSAADRAARGGLLPGGLAGEVTSELLSAFATGRIPAKVDP